MGQSSSPGDGLVPSSGRPDVGQPRVTRDYVGPAFARVALPDMEVSSTRATPYLNKTIEDVRAVLEGKQSITNSAALFVTELAAPLPLPPTPSAGSRLVAAAGAGEFFPFGLAVAAFGLLATGALAERAARETDRQRVILAACLDAVLNAGPNARATIPFRGGAIALHVLEKSATAQDYPRYFRRSGIIDEQVPDLDVAQEFDRAIASRLSELPVEYAVRRAALSALRDATRSAVAQALEPSLNRRVGELPSATYEDKRVLARWVNAELREFGLAIRCPKTSLAAHLVADQGRDPQVGRFQLEVTGPSGLPKRTLSAVVLPALELMPDLARRKARTDEPGQGPGR